MSENPSLDAGVYPFHHTVRVRFAETDAMGIVHHSRYLPYLEAARVEFLREAGHPYDRLRDDGVDFAVVEAWSAIDVRCDSTTSSTSTSASGP